MTRPVGPNWSSGCAASRSRRSVWRRAEVTNAAQCEPCLRPACRHARSTRSSCGSSHGPVGFWPRNDPLDARMIASFVAIMPTQPAQPRAPAIERLAEMLAVRRQLSAEKVAAENASRLLEDAMLQRLSRRRIRRLAADIEMLDRHLAEIVGTDAALAHRYRLLTSDRKSV